MVSQVKRETMRACLSCPLCDSILRDATSISECLHTCQSSSSVLIGNHLLLFNSAIFMIMHISCLWLKLFNSSSRRVSVEKVQLGQLLTKNMQF